MPPFHGIFELCILSDVSRCSSAIKIMCCSCSTRGRRGEASLEDEGVPTEATSRGTVGLVRTHIFLIRSSGISRTHRTRPALAAHMDQALPLLQAPG